MDKESQIFMEEIINKIAEKFPSQKNVKILFDTMMQEEKESFSSCLQCIKKLFVMSVYDIVNCYDMFVKDTLEETKFFLDNDRYRYSTYTEVDRYMASKKESYMQAYQVGLLISLFIWPNHSEMRKHFIDILKACKSGKYLEIGVGHGYYFSQAVSNFNFQSYLGIDINADSLKMAKAIVNENPKCSGKNYTLELMDFFKMDNSDKFDVIVSGEVLEHVENPEIFLRKFSCMADENTLIYVSTAINAPAVDHISLFRSPEQLNSLFKDNGLSIVEMKLFLYRGKSLEICLKKKFPITVAITAKKLK